MHSITHNLVLKQYQNNVCDRTVRMYERIIERFSKLDCKDKTFVEHKLSEDKNRLMLKYQVEGLVRPLVITVDKFSDNAYMLYYSGTLETYRAMLHSGVTSVEEAISTILKRPFTLTCQNNDDVAYVNARVYKHVEDGSFTTVCYSDRSFIVRRTDELTKVTIHNRHGLTNHVDLVNNTDDVRKVVKSLYSLSVIGDTITDITREEDTCLNSGYEISNYILRSVIKSRTKKQSLTIIASVWEGMITLDWFEGDTQLGRVEGVPELITFSNATSNIINNWITSTE